MAELGRVPELIRIELSARARRTVAQLLCVVALGAGAWAFLSAFAVRHGYFDLRVYYGAVNFWVRDGGQIYDYLMSRTGYGFTYPPFAALLMSPMAFVSWKVAIAISLALSMISMFAIIYWMVGPVVERRGWPRWFAFVVSAELLAVFEPLRETINFGQVNLLLVALVMADVLFLIRRGHRFSGVGIGLATAIKLTPGAFIIYLLVTRRWRAAGVAVAAAGTATWLAATIAPDASRVFWTDAMWNTDRVGSTAFVSNQSLNGIVSRLNPIAPSSALWGALLLASFVIWMLRVRKAVESGDELAAMALTGIFMCMISPITWVHHLVWVLPAVILLADHGLDQSRPRRWRRAILLGAVLAYALLCSRAVWAFEFQYQGIGYLGSNLYVYLMCLLLLVLPIRENATTEPEPAVGDFPTAEDVPDLVDLDRQVTAAFDAQEAGRSLGVSDPLAKAGIP